MIRRVLAQGWRPEDAAEAAGVSVRTFYKWLQRYREEGEKGLRDRRCTPHRVPRRTSEARTEKILALRQRRLTGWQIAQRLGVAPSTVAAVLKRAGLARLSALDPKPAPRRFEREKPGELLHLDVKNLGRIGAIGHRIHGDRGTRARGVGWEYVHVAVDDASRVAYVEVLPDQKGETAVGFLERAGKWFRKRGIRIQRLLSDNGSCYVSRRFRQACKRLGIRHLRTRAYRPQTNGKAERFIQTLIRGWAYSRPYRTSNQRTKALPKWLRYYNEQRPHRALGMIPPIQRVKEAA
jgi:transposase InsO family protein